MEKIKSNFQTPLLNLLCLYLQLIGGNNLLVSAMNCRNLQFEILSQTCSASGCERNWSVFERIHTKKRSRLEKKRLNDMVFVQYNLRLRRN
jgi:hypothetical protein